MLGRCDDRPFDLATQHIILEIVGFLEVGFPSFELNLNVAQQAFNPNSCVVVAWIFLRPKTSYFGFLLEKAILRFSNFEVLVGMQNLRKIWSERSKIIRKQVFPP